MAHTGSVTFSGRSLLVNRIKGVMTEPLNIHWGLGNGVTANTAAANSDVGLFQPSPEARTAGTSTGISTSFLADTYQVTGAITATAARTITEVGLFDTSTLAATGTIAATLTSGALSVTLGSTIGPTTNNFYIQMENECALVTGGQNTSVFTITRGQFGSSAAGHVSGTALTVGGDGGAKASFGVGGQTVTTVVQTSYGGDIFAHADFGSLILASGDSILFTITDQFSGA